MKEKYCISFEQAKELDGMAFTKPSQFRWLVYKGEDPFLTDSGSLIHDCRETYPAYHVGELGEILTSWVVRSIEFDDNGWNAFYRLELIGKYSTEAQARGALLIYLIENNLL